MGKQAKTDAKRRKKQRRDRSQAKRYASRKRQRRLGLISCTVIRQVPVNADGSWTVPPLTPLPAEAA